MTIIQISSSSSLQLEDVVLEVENQVTRQCPIHKMLFLKNQQLHLFIIHVEHLTL
jgi:hypothetical protein